MPTVRRYSDAWLDLATDSGLGVPVERRFRTSRKGDWPKQAALPRRGALKLRWKQRAVRVPRPIAQGAKHSGAEIVGRCGNAMLASRPNFRAPSRPPFRIPP